MDIRKILEYALQREYEGKRFFEQNATWPELPQSGFFADRADRESIVDTVAESMIADLSVFRMAYLSVRDFSEFYALAASSAEGEARKMLNMLAHWEADPKRLFKNMHDKAFEIFSGMPRGD